MTPSGRRARIPFTAPECICSQTIGIRIDDQMIGAERINKFNFRYSLGESLNLNCSSEATLPPANLTWYINQKPVHKLFYYQNIFSDWNYPSLRFPPINWSSTRSSTWAWGERRPFTRRCSGSDTKSWGKRRRKAFSPAFVFPASANE